MIKTEVVEVRSDNIDMDIVRKAGTLLREGKLVVFPTETVYGLGANGLDEQAVKRIFEAKGRPSDNPLILHISSTGQMDRLVTRVPERAVKLMERFWPGPMTLVLEKSPLVPGAVTAGLDTVAIRMPDHPVAKAVIEHAGVPVAAPSANLSGKPSPTSARHVVEDLMGRVDMIIDSGDVSIGVESTVVDLTSERVTVLRPGGVTLEQLREVLGEVDLDPGLINGENSAIPKAPGMKYTHYSPEADVIIVDGRLEDVVDRIKSMAGSLEDSGKRVGILATDQTKDLYARGLVISAGDRNAPGTIAARLFGLLREFDKKGVDVILAEAIEERDVGLAVMNRLLKSAGYNVIRV
ncbi:MAG: Threonylcarbamoyl-AMP synthase [Firmicutes bacterium]|nr:Threonylcarbamoyl-AMP synthase [Bacillota bacterium]MDI6706074.1 L-threonylcarbamoyladenylate synthase [Bacillota bacterium]